MAGCHGGGLVAGRTGVVGDRLTVLNPLTTLLTHVEGAPTLQLAVSVVGLKRAVKFTIRVGALHQYLAVFAEDLNSSIEQSGLEAPVPRQARFIFARDRFG
ncbi:MAG: hypothetical protein HOI21_06295 [Bacteroidetes Order II. Incertae sedis bacterium]|nr:hypothetical protein [Bacteroidetes Order II. bacterium]MBT6423546.1 hypothetical protein [Bacteroidetes Order II. bacterium]